MLANFANASENWAKYPRTHQLFLRFLLSLTNSPLFLGELAVATSLYYIWRARNKMVHKQEEANADKIVKLIVEETRLIVAAWRGESRTKENLEIVLE